MKNAEKIFRALVMLLLLSLMMFLLGSSRVEKHTVVPSAETAAAAEIGEALPAADRLEWQEICRKKPLFLIQLSSY